GESKDPPRFFPKSLIVGIRVRQPAAAVRDVVADGGQADVPSRRERSYLRLAQQRQQQVFAGDRLVAALSRFIARKRQQATCFLGVSLEHCVLSSSRLTSTKHTRGGRPRQPKVLKRLPDAERRRPRGKNRPGTP